MSEKIWLKSYPADMPSSIDISGFASLAEHIEHTCRKFATLPAFSNLGQTLTFAEIDRLSRDFAAYLRTLPGIANGDRVAIMLPNLLQYPVVLFGILRAGLTVVNVNPLYTARELAFQLKDSGAKAIVILENFAATLARILPETAVETVITTQVGDLLPPPGAGSSTSSSSASSAWFRPGVSPVRGRCAPR